MADNRVLRLSFAAQPIHQVVLPVDAQVQPADGKIGEGALPVGGE